MANVEMLGFTSFCPTYRAGIAAPQSVGTQGQKIIWEGCMKMDAL